MYHAKATGKRRSVVFQPSMHASMVERYELLNQLDRAIDDHEISIVFQPLVTLDGALRGGEALARWVHPERGTILPDAFIPLAEETSTITKITRLALTDACRAINEGIVSQVSVNISATDRATRLRRVGAIGAAGGERAARRHHPRDHRVAGDAARRRVAGVHRVRRVGVRLALDDFGTGYSSLAALREYPINQLKIAKPFIDELETDPAAVKFVELIIGLGRNLDMEVVAEGIERKAQVDILSALGCHLGQGYYFARPLTAEQFRTAWGKQTVG